MGTLVIIIPAFNEEKTIGDIIQRIPKDLFSNISVVVINDGSTDRTKDVAKEAGAEVITFRRNRGLAEAFRKGIKYAVSMDADIIVNIDADNQYDPQGIKELIEPIIKEEADLVLGSRFKGTIESMPQLKRFGNVAFTSLLKFLTKEPISDAQTGFRAFTREVAEMIDIYGHYTYTQQMILQASYHRFKIVEVPVKFSARVEGESKLMRSPMHFAYKAMEILLLIISIYYPIKVFGLLGTILIIFGVFFGVSYTQWNVLSSLIISTGILFILFGTLFMLTRTKIDMNKKS